MLVRTALSVALAVLLVSGCQSPKKYGGVKYKLTLDSSPTGAELYLVPRSEWLGMEAPRAAQDLKRWLVKANGGQAPVVDYYVVDYQHTLVGRLGGASGSVDFKPTHHGQKVVVTLDQN